MSDTPLFQNSDAHEALYGGTPQPNTADQADSSTVPPLVVPAAGVLGGGLAGALWVKVQRRRTGVVGVTATSRRASSPGPRRSGGSADTNGQREQ